jgi:propionyl-CoA synthetase
VSGTPDAGAFWRVVAEHDVRAMFTAPTAVRAIRREDPDGAFIRDERAAGRRTLFVADERCETTTLPWARRHTGTAVVDHWWQTETGWQIATNPVRLHPNDVPAESVGRPAPGMDVRILDDDGNEVGRGVPGNMAIRLPLPPGSALTLWDDDRGSETAHFERSSGLYATGDAGSVDENGDTSIVGRTRDVINVSGHRLPTGATEQVVACRPAVAKCAVIGTPDELKGDVPAAFVTIVDGYDGAIGQLSAELIARVRATTGPVAAFRTVVLAKQLPKTRPGKLLRKTMRSLAIGDDVSMPATIESPAALTEFAAALSSADRRGARVS